MALSAPWRRELSRERTLLSPQRRCRAERLGGLAPDDFEHPERVELRSGHHLRPIRADDVDIDYPAVMGSRERLWARYGEAWGLAARPA